MIDIRGDVMRHVKERFHRRAVIVVICSLAAASGAAAPACALLSLNGVNSVTLLPAVAAGLILVGLWAQPAWNGMALRWFAKNRPDAVFFLARQQPDGTSDLATHLYRNDVHTDISDRWLPTLVDHRGIAAWSGGPRPKEILLMEWREIGEITATPFTNIHGRQRFGIAIDVVPFDVPLIVLVGYSRFCVQSHFDPDDTRAVAEATNAVRSLVKSRG
jgi:hypothetical protein